MQKRLLVALVAAVAIAVTLVILLLVPVVPRTGTFDLSQTLPTGSSAFNGQIDCGSNVTVAAVFPSDAIVSYRITQNESHASVNIWMLGGGVSLFENSGYGGSISGNFTSGNGHFSFVFQACGPTPTVSLGFWGSTHYSVPIL